MTKYLFIALLLGSPQLSKATYNPYMAAAAGGSNFRSTSKTAVTNASYHLEMSLLQGYSKLAIPNQNNSNPFWIYTDVTLYQLLELNFRLQMIKVLIWETTHWVDANLKWDPEEFANITSIRLMDTDIWTPDLVISESIAEEESGVNPIGLLVTFDGTVLWMRPKILTAACSINVLYFPNDRQECSLTIGTWYHTAEYIRIAFNDPNITVQESDLSYSLTKIHDEWEIDSLTGRMVTTDYSHWGNYSELAYTLKLRRKPLFYHINFILPTIVIGLLGTCMFFIPITSGEKVSFGITLLLALTVNQLIVSEKLPVTSENLPFLCIYFLVTILLNSFAICACLVVYNIHSHASPYPVPLTLKFICFKILDPFFSFRFTVFCRMFSGWCKRRCHVCCESKFCCCCRCASRCIIRVFAPSRIKRENVNGVTMAVDDTENMIYRLQPGSKWRVVQKAMRQGKLKKELWNDAGFMGCFNHNGIIVPQRSSVFRARKFDPDKMINSLHQVVQQMNKNKEDWMRVATILDKAMGVVYLVTILTADMVLLYTLSFPDKEEALQSGH